MIKPNGNLSLTEEKRIRMKKELKELFRDMLEIMEFDPDHPQLKDTPDRMSRMYVDELFKGCYEPAPKMTAFPKEGPRTEDFIFLGPIEVKSMCSHHFLPFVGSVYIGYIPRKDVVGISKLARAVQWFMRRPQIQEEFTDDLCDFIYETLDAKSVIVHCEASHMCMTLRGVEQPMGSTMGTTASKGTHFAGVAAVGYFFNQIQRSKM